MTIKKEPTKTRKTRGSRAVRIPENLMISISLILKEYPKLGYKSRLGFIKDAIRRRIQVIEKLKRFSKSLKKLEM